MFDFDEMEDAEAMAPLKVFAFSDLHTDYAENLEWIQNLEHHPEDVLIVAGDVSHKVQILRDTLGPLRRKFREVFFCPGNHDLWLDKEDGCADSMEKFALVEALCAELDIRTEPMEVNGVLIVPVLSWYEPGFDTEPEVTGEEFPPVEKALKDFRFCKWPEGLSASDSTLSEHFDTLNKARERIRAASADRIPVVSFSHYLPRPELLPEKRALFFPPLSKAVGSRALRKRVEGLSSLAPPGEHVHVFGHTHYGWAAEHGGVKYIQAAVGSPSERKSRQFALALSRDPVPSSKLPHVSSLSSVSTMASAADACEDGTKEVAQPVLVLDPDADSKVPKYRSLWSDHYAQHGFPRGAPSTRERQWLYAHGPQPAVLEAVRSTLLEGKKITDCSIQAKLGGREKRSTGFWAGGYRASVVTSTPVARAA